ncbi:C4-type zinc finger protein YbiI, partial [Klebsiella pneumoniae]|nr:C4-type zinc finger protein YbiI [Klebsiella pneumoniae]
LDECEECGAPIPQARREAIPGVRLCIHCQQEKDLQKPAYTGYNRRGSKDSQLR